MKGRGSFRFSGEIKERPGERMRKLYLFTRFRITKKSRGAVGKKGRQRITGRKREKHRELAMSRETVRSK